MDKKNELGYKPGQWHRLSLKISAEEVSLALKNKRKVIMDSKVSAYRGVPSKILDALQKESLMFFGSFEGSFMEIRIWKVERPKETELELSSRPLQVIFDEAKKLTFILKKKKKEGNFCLEFIHIWNGFYQKLII